jgi:hypothetical protein
MSTKKLHKNLKLHQKSLLTKLNRKEINLIIYNLLKTSTYFTDMPQ